MGLKYSDVRLIRELYAKPFNLLSNLANSAKRATIRRVKEFYEELRMFRKIMLPYYKRKIHQKIQECYKKYPCTTFFSCLWALGLPIPAVIGTLVSGEPPGLAYVAIPSLTLTVAYLTDKGIIRPPIP